MTFHCWLAVFMYHYFKTIHVIVDFSVINIGKLSFLTQTNEVKMSSPRSLHANTPEDGRTFRRTTSLADLDDVSRKMLTYINIYPADDIFETFFSYFSQKTGFDIS